MEKERKRKKIRRGRGDQASQGMELGFFCMETHLDHEFYEIWHGSLVLYGYYLASNLGFVKISS